MEENKADQLWRELNDTDKAAKRGFGIGFSHVPGGDGQRPSGLGSHFRKATDVASKEMAQEKISARDRIRDRIKNAMQEKRESLRKEDSHWEDFLRRKKREAVGLTSIVDDQGKMLGCTYQYTDKDNADLEHAISKAKSSQALQSANAEDSHAAAIFGGHDSNRDPCSREADTSSRRLSARHPRRSPSPATARRGNLREDNRHTSLDSRRDWSHQSNRSTGAPDSRDAHRYTHRQYEIRRDESPSRHPRSRDARDVERAGRDHRRDQRGPDRHPHRESRSDRRGDWAQPAGFSSRSRREQVHRRDRDDNPEDRARHRSGLQNDGRRAVRQASERKSSPAHRSSHDHGNSKQAHSGTSKQLHTEGTGRLVDSKSGPSMQHPGSKPDTQVNMQSKREQAGVERSPGSGVWGHVRGAPPGRPEPGGGGRVGGHSYVSIVPEGAAVVDLSEAVPAPAEVQAHDALDAAAVLQARGSWRDRLKHRMEGGGMG